MISAWGPRAYKDDIFRSRILGHNYLTFNTPAAIRHVLLQNSENYTRGRASVRVLRPVLGNGLLLAEGREWKHQRRTLAPAFAPRAAGTWIPHIVAAADEAVAKLAKGSRDSIDLYASTRQVMLGITGRAMFSLEMRLRGGQLADFVMEYTTHLSRITLLDLLLPLGLPSPRDISRAAFRRRWMRFVRTLVTMRLEAGKSEGAPPRDLFDLMISARDPESGEPFSCDQLADQVATMIVAGFDTTAGTLFWALYLLALDTATQEKVAVEARAVDYFDNFDGLKFTYAVIAETLRLYPPAFLLEREAAGADLICGTPISRGDMIFISPWLLHRHEKLWDAPEAFLPNRFMPGSPELDRFVYLPFGAGPRSCIGAHFASVALILTLAKFVGAFHIELVDRDPVVPIGGGVTIRPSRSPKFRLTLRGK
ncbi:cytochrome P450 [Bradyrhizobium sp. SZCCHNR2035]|uniref:cytochrome P450 n=1 Tax=Bradyrhizobium sp. SZCCHNR2035 TaxID=3057386 RepID=UPI002916F179|nr:cytochrome P450 [Bradyrhizobium sp. SZCCHNR2035]